VAAREAWADAGAPELDPERLGVVVGTGIGGALTLLGQDDILEQQGVRKVAVLTVPMLMPNGPAAAVGLWAKARGGVHAPVSACASGAEALAWAYRMIKSGELDIAIAGGAEACVHPLPMAGFAQMRAMSTRNHDPLGASRPFDVERDGFVLGEGAGIMVLEEYEHAKARGARIYCEIAGYGMSADAHHITAPPEDGNGAARSMLNAMRNAGIAVTDVDYINAHGTSTPLGDVAECVAVKRAFGDHARRLAVSSTKSMTGHLLGAAAGIEAIFTVLAIRDQSAPPTANLVNIDPRCDLDFVPLTARRMPIRAALSNSFGFGGTNATLAFRTIAA
jgi:3-oxoacyl-[acyl-carrier-protein] synthase II